MKIATRLGFCCWLCAVSANATDDEGERAALAARGPSPAVTAATVDRFAECYAAEGQSLSETDRTVLREALSPLARVVTDSLAEAQCADGGDEARCAAAVKGISCAALAGLLQPPAPATAPAWTQGYARTLTDRIAACFVAESGAPLGADESRAIEGFKGAITSALTASASDEGCRVDENQLPVCALSLRSMPCDSLAQKLDGDVAVAPGVLSDACLRVIRCEGGDTQDPDLANAQASGEVPTGGR